MRRQSKGSIASQSRVREEGDPRAKRTNNLNEDGEWTSGTVLRDADDASIASTGGLRRQQSMQDLEESSSDDDSVDAVLDIKRTFLNIGLFVFTIGGWKGVWDAQDVNNLPWWLSVSVGILVYILRFKVDDVLDTHDVHSEDWFELFSEMPELSLKTFGEYGKIYLSSGLVFVSSLFIWRGVWAGFDAAGLDWVQTLIIGAIGYVILSVLQLDLEIQRSIEDPEGNRSPSLFNERDTLLTPLTLVPEEYKKESESDPSDDSPIPPPPMIPPPESPR